jgi:hypothetical protein
VAQYATAAGSIPLTIYWATFNGTWAANPRVDFSVFANGSSAQMRVFRPDSTSKVWAIDKAIVTTTTVSVGTPWIVSSAGLTTSNPDTVTSAIWGMFASQGWFNPAGTGWVITGSPGTQGYNNLSALTYGVSFGHHLDAASGTVVPAVQETLGNTATVTTSIMSWCAKVGAATYYVSSIGNDSNAGTGQTAGTAWKTLTPVNSHVFVPGDIVNFAGGQTFTGGLYIHNVASTQASPVTLQSYGTGKATISSAAGSVGCYIYQMGGVSIQNLNFSGPGIATANKEGILFYNDVASTVYPYIRINGCAITGYTDGISIGGGSGSSGYSDVRVENSDSYANKKNGILLFAVNNNSNSNVYIGYCKAYNNTGRMDKHRLRERDSDRRD